MVFISAPYMSLRRLSPLKMKSRVAMVCMSRARTSLGDSCEQSRHVDISTIPHVKLEFCVVQLNSNSFGMVCLSDEYVLVRRVVVCVSEISCSEGPFVSMWNEFEREV